MGPDNCTTFLVFVLMFFTTGLIEKVNSNISHGRVEENAQDEESEYSGNRRDIIAGISNKVAAYESNRHRRSPNMSESSQIYGGATYIRWGRTTCPDDPYTDLVYTGLAGGSLSTHEGGAADLLCLPHVPIWGQYDGSVSGYAYVYGVEYRDNFNGFQTQNMDGNALNYNNVPCAFCRSRIRSSAMMIPARNICFEKWHLEYHGYLMAGYHSGKGATQYTCVDVAPEAVPGGISTQDGRFLVRVDAICGSLPCPKYVNGRELTCAVCTFGNVD